MAKRIQMLEKWEEEIQQLLFSDKNKDDETESPIFETYIDGIKHTRIKDTPLVKDFSNMILDCEEAITALREFREIFQILRGDIKTNIVREKIESMIEKTRLDANIQIVVANLDLMINNKLQHYDIQCGEYLCRNCNEPLRLNLEKGLCTLCMSEKPKKKIKDE